MKQQDPLEKRKRALLELERGPILLYDGECGVCSAAVQFILNNERQHTLRFCPLDSSLGHTLRKQANVEEEVDSVLFCELEGGRVAARRYSEGLFRVARYLGGPFKLLLAFAVAPRPFRDFAYRLFAKHRHRFAPKHCLIPPPQTRSRFLSG